MELSKKQRAKPVCCSLLLLQLVCVLVLTCYSTSVPSRFTLLCLCVCVCVCFDSQFVFGCCHCCPVLLVPSSSGPPFFSFYFQSPCLSFFFFRKGLWELRLTSTHSLPEPCKSLASCPWLLHFKLLSLFSSPLLFFFLSSFSVQGNAWNNCLSMCCGRGNASLRSEQRERLRSGTRGWPGFRGAGGSHTDRSKNQKQ